MIETNDSAAETSAETAAETAEANADSGAEVSAADISAAYETVESSVNAEASASRFECMFDEAISQHGKSFETLSDKEYSALGRPSEDRTWRETEIADSLRHPEYATQLSFTKDTEGNIVEASHAEKGSHRPDGIRLDEQGVIDIRELKDYHNKDSLMHNMAEQAADRYAFFGEDARVTFAIAANEFSVQDAAQLQDYVENRLHGNIDWITK